MKKKSLLICLISLVCFLTPNSIFPQQMVGIPIKKQEAFVLEFKPPFDRLTVDLGDNSFTTNETTVFSISPQAVFLNNKNKPLDRTLIRPGMRVIISGNRIGEQLTASSVKVDNDVEKWKVVVNGYFESLEGDKAWIDGQSVKLLPGVTVRGTGDWKKNTFASFNDMQLGSYVEIDGIRQTDGITCATKAETKPNTFSDGDRKLFTAVQQNLVIPENLAGGKGKVWGREVKFSDNLELQTYVTKVGNRLIPRYQKDLPNDYPGKIVYRFFVIEDDSFNAFALPDGSIFIHTGLLKQLKNEAQLAAVLGHEIAHAGYEHSRKKIEDPTGKWLALAAVIAGAATKTKEGATIGTMTALGILNSYERAAEDQADRVGLYYMMQAGYDPREAPKVWRELSKKTKEAALNNLIYSNHSTAQQRLRNLNRVIAFNYYETDFSQTKNGEKEYMNTVGVYFGWIPKPVVPPVRNNTPSPSVTIPKPKPTPKPTPKKPRVKKRP